MNDLISRQAVLDYIDSMPSELTNDGRRMIRRVRLTEYISELPSAQKQGKWIRHTEVKNVYGGIYIECSECGKIYVVQYIDDEKYCRHCGARMTKGED